MTGGSAEIYGWIGRELAAFIAKGSGQAADPHVLAGVVADLAGSADELIAPLKDLVRRPGFAALAVYAGSRSGAIQRDALLRELKIIYSPQVVERLTDLLNAFLDLSPSPAAHPRKQPLITSEPVVQGSPQQPIAPAAVPLERRPAPAPAPVQRPSRWPLVAAGLLAALSAAAAGLFIRQPPFCGVFRLCPREQSAAVHPQGIDQARRSARALRRASALPELERGLAQLRLDLSRIDRQTLSPQQAEQLNQLEALADQTRARLALEAGYKRRLQQASEAITAAQATQDPAVRQDWSERARLALADIPANSLANPEARALQAVLNQLQNTPAEPAPIPGDGASSREVKAPSPEPAQLQPQLATPPPQPAPAPAAAPAPEPAPASLESRSRPESAVRSPSPPAAQPLSPSSGEGSKRYTLPPQWEERRARRREILNQYRQERP